MLVILCPLGMEEAGVCVNHPSPGETTDLLHTTVLKLRGVSGSSCPLLAKNRACCVSCCPHIASCLHGGVTWK